VCSSMETMPLDGKMGGDVCVMCVSLAKSLPSVSFSFPPERVKPCEYRMIFLGFSNPK